MSRRTCLGATALVAVAAMCASACDTSSSKHRATRSASTTTTVAPFAVTPTREITVTTLLVAPTPSGHDVGRTAPITVGIRPSTDRALNVVFEETAVGGTAAQWEAAGWSAVAVATLITGAPLGGREIDFKVTGRADGVSTGALMTIAVIALIRGDALEHDVAMTGAIDPDGTIGPVGGIAEKIGGAAASHKTRMLIPRGQRNSADDSGRVVDAVVAGRAVGVHVSAVADVYGAYREFTGRPLAPFPEPTGTRLAKRAYDKLGAASASWLAKFAASSHDFLSLAPEVQQAFGSYAATAARDAQAAKTLANDGLQAGAFGAAVSAAALMAGIAQTGAALPVLLAQGIAPFVSRIRSSQSLTDRIRGVVESLRAFEPHSVSDADALISAYHDATDAASLAAFAGKLFETGADQQHAINDVAEGAIYSFVAGSLTDAASEILSAGRGQGGPVLASNSGSTVSAASRLLRRAAEANLAAFQSVVLVPRTTGGKASLGSAERAFAVGDLDYALAQFGDAFGSAFPAYFGAGAATSYAGLGAALAFYERTTELLAKYNGLGRVDPRTQQLSGIANATGFNAVIRVAQTQLESNLGWLRSKGVSPASVAADNELAGIDRNGDASDRFDALGEYWDGYLAGRVLAYAGGFSGP